VTEPIRIAMWSGPRNISTAMMRAFENRPDTAVIDEPFYAVFLTRTGLAHPMREAILRAQPTQPAEVIATLVGPVPGARAIFYQKHMTHHMLHGIDRGWMRGCRHAFLIRSPRRVLASYVAKRGDVTLEDIGFVQQAELFDEIAQALGHAPPVQEANDVHADPRRALTTLCQALGVPFDEAMLRWPTGRRSTDGVWAPVWYGAVERSTGFSPSVSVPIELSPQLEAIAQAATPYYERLARYRI